MKNSDGPRVGLKAQVMETETGLQHFRKSLRGESRRFKNFWLNGGALSPDELHEDRVFHSAEGRRTAQKNARRLDEWRKELEASRRPSPKPGDSRKELFSYYGLQHSGSEPSVSALQQLLKESQVRSGLRKRSVHIVEQKVTLKDMEKEGQGLGLASLFRKTVAAPRGFDAGLG